MSLAIPFCIPLNNVIAATVAIDDEFIVLTYESYKQIEKNYKYLE